MVTLWMKWSRSKIRRRTRSGRRRRKLRRAQILRRVRRVRVKSRSLLGDAVMSMRTVRHLRGAALGVGAYLAALASMEARSSMISARIITSAWVDAALLRRTNAPSLISAHTNALRMTTALESNVAHSVGAAPTRCAMEERTLGTCAPAEVNASVTIVTRMMWLLTGARMLHKWNMPRT